MAWRTWVLSWEREREFIFENYELGIENYEFANFGKKGEWGKKMLCFDLYQNKTIIRLNPKQPNKNNLQHIFLLLRLKWECSV